MSSPVPQAITGSEGTWSATDPAGRRHGGRGWLGAGAAGLRAARAACSVVAGGGAVGPYRSMSSATLWAAWLGPRSARSRLKTSTQWLRASSRDSATRWATLWRRPRVMATYADAAPVVSPSGEVCGVDSFALSSVGGGGERELDVLVGRTRAGSARRPGRPTTSRLPSSPIPATVHVSRLATARSRSLRRLATRSPRPIRSPRRVIGSRAARQPASPGGAADCSPTRWRWARMAAFSALTWSRVSAITSWSPHHQALSSAQSAPMSARAAVRSDLAGVEDDLPALEQVVEHVTRALAGAHEEAEVGVPVSPASAQTTRCCVESRWSMPRSPTATAIGCARAHGQCCSTRSASTARTRSEVRLRTCSGTSSRSSNGHAPCPGHDRRCPRPARARTARSATTPTRGDQPFDLAAYVGCVPCRPLRAEPGQHEVGSGVAVDPTDPQTRRCRGNGGWA